SSRRRHTRSDRDWSSDVCSSDLQNKHERFCRGGPGSPFSSHENRRQFQQSCWPPSNNFGGDSTARSRCLGNRHESSRRGCGVIEIGRASCRERVEISVVGASIKK